MSDEKTNTEADDAPEGDKGSAVEKWLNGLSDAQLAAVKATVNTVAEQRQEPSYGAMSDNELRATVRKKFGYSSL